MNTLDDLLAIMRKLRDVDAGCPWDREQSYASLVPYTLEEAYEVAETIEENQLDKLPDELGDLLFQIVFYSQIASEENRFTFYTVITHICDKLIRRHPHVFATDKIETAEEQTVAWEQHKQKERMQSDIALSGLLDGVSLALPALTRAAKVQRRAARAGFDWPNYQGVLDKIYEELDEVKAELPINDPQRIEDELGDLLFTCVNLSRHLKVDSERALRKATRKFEDRFRFVESALEISNGKFTATLDEMEMAWQQAKNTITTDPD
jgi:MazG family protein